MTPDGGGGESGSAAAGAETTPAAAGADSVSAPEGAAAIDPTSYTFTFPEEFKADDALVAKARTTLAEAGVPADKAQGVVDLYIDALRGAQAAATAEFTAQQAAWKTEIDAMPEFQGATRETSLQAIAKVFDEYGPEAREALSNPAIGNDPRMARFMLKIANALSEGGPATPGRAAPSGRDGRSLSTRRSTAEVLFPDQMN